MGLTALGWAVQAAYLGNRAWSSGHIPVTTLFESLLVLSWILAAIVLWAIASATGQSQGTVSTVLDSLFSTVSDAVSSGSKVSIPGWIAFEQVSTAARTGRNPQTGAEIKIAAGKRVKVTAGSKLKAAVK